MKIFIAGSKNITQIPDIINKKIIAICKKGYTIIIGDCYGVDVEIQKILKNINYENVIIYATGRPRNNVGNWQTITVSSSGKTGFDFYKQKDLQMIKDCDGGIFVWDGISRGTKEDFEGLTILKKPFILFNRKENTCKNYKFKKNGGL